MEAWLSFLIVVSVQLFLLVFIAYRNRQLPFLWSRKFLYVLLLAIVFGIAFDLIVGHLFGVFTYFLGFTFPFLILNGFFSYGFLFAKIALLKDAPWLNFFTHVVVIALIYELVNYAFRVWQWAFASELWSTYLVVVMILYPGLAVGIWTILRTTHLIIPTQAYDH